MLQPDKINPKETSLIKEIVNNETWLMDEKMGHAVDPKSPEVLSRVVEIVLKIGDQWRTNIESDHGYRRE